MGAATGVDGAARIAAAFSGHGRTAALMPYMMGGYPDRETSRKIARAYVDGGADLIEFGLPFSDPLADGPVIHEAAVEALASGALIDQLLDDAAAVAGELPVMVMTYFNLIHARGVERFLGRAVESGVSGLIVPDIPLEHFDLLRGPCERHGIALVPLVAPTTTDERMAEICAAAQGFIYVVSVAGTTGERAATAEGVGELVERVRSHTDLPVAVGFGISEPAQARAVGELSDGAIVGSRLVRAAGEAHAAGEDVESAVRTLVAEFSAALA